jgi:excisionase family DNA binding protein
MGDAQQPRDLPSSDSLLLTPEEAATVLRVGRTTVYALMKAGDLRPVHIGRSCRISRAELERYVRHLQAPPPPRRARTGSRRRRSSDQGSLFDVVHSPPDRP